jgi:hypothetical protein
MRQKFFLSFNSADRIKAHWIAWTLKKAGHEVAVHDWEIPAGGNAPLWMNNKLAWADRLIAVISPDYVPSRYSPMEWASQIWDDPDGTKGSVIPVIVRPTSKMPPLLKDLRRIDLTNCSEAEAKRRLIEGVDMPAPPERKPTFDRIEAEAPDSQHIGPPEKPTFVRINVQAPRSLRVSAAVAALALGVVAVFAVLAFFFGDHADVVKDQQLKDLVTKFTAGPPKDRSDKGSDHQATVQSPSGQVVIGGNVSGHGTVIGQVVGNVYVQYEAAKSEAATATSSRSLILITEDVRVAKNANLPDDLVIRFSIYNRSKTAVKIYDFKTIEYTQMRQLRFFAPPEPGDPPRRYNLEIAPGKPFIEEDKTFDVPPGQNLSFHLTFRMFYDLRDSQAVLGVIAYANDETGARYKIKSDHLFLVSPSYGTAASFDQDPNSMKEALSVNRQKRCYSALESGQTRCEWEQAIDSIGYLKDALKEHESI